MAKTTKATAGMSSKAPVKNKSYVQSKTAGLESGKSARAKADYKKAVKGGAAKAASKLEKDIKSDSNVNTRSGSMFNPGKVTTVISRAAERKAMAQRIINDKSKNVTRAKIAEMNAIKKTKKKSK
jgi:hypothetical protein